MVKLLIIIGLFLSVGFGLSYLHFYPNSYLLITLGDISIETSLAVAIGIGLVVLACLWLAISLARGLIAIPDRLFRNWLGVRKSQRQQHLNLMMLAHLAGDERTVLHHLTYISNSELGATERLALEVHNLLQRGNPRLAAPLLDKLERKVRNRAQKQLAMQLRATYWSKTGNYQQIANLELPARIRKHSFWHETIAKAAVATGNWDLLHKQLKAHPGLGQHYWVEALTHTHEDKQLDKVWSTLPSKDQDNPAIARAYLERLITANRDKDAQNFMLHVAGTPRLYSLLTLLGKIENIHQPDKMLHKLEKLYKKHLSTQEALHTEQSGYFALALGRLCNQLELYGKAEDYLEPLTEHTSHLINSQANLEMAKTLAKRREIEPAIGYLQAVQSADSAVQLMPSEQSEQPEQSKQSEQSEVSEHTDQPETTSKV